MVLVVVNMNSSTQTWNLLVPMIVTEIITKENVSKFFEEKVAPKVNQAMTDVYYYGDPGKIEAEIYEALPGSRNPVYQESLGSLDPLAAYSMVTKEDIGAFVQIYTIY